ncbi:MAG TPA: helix-turn-helix domain-containing protein, partial [bacterium]|nr:helix-turn-helix domain-containing protein [bacterium]
DEAVAGYTGGGSFGTQAEHFLRETYHQALSPSSLLAMAGAGFAFRSSRLLFLRLFTEAGVAGAPLRTAAALGAFNVEALSFPVLSRLSSQAFGHPADWQGQALRRDLLSSYLFLGGLRGSHHVAGRWLQAGPLTRAAATYGGVVAGSALESLAGLKSFDSPESLFAHSLGTYLQFQLAGRVLHSALGPRFQRMERTMDLQAQSLESTPRGFQPWLKAGSLAAAPVGPGSAAGLHSSIWLAMSQSLPEIRLPTTNGASTRRPPSPPEPTRRESEPEEISIHTQYEIAAALVRHRGNMAEAARDLGIAPPVLEQKMSRENFFSEFSVFQSSRNGRMLFYRPALGRAHSIFGSDIYRERSLNELGLSPETSEFVRQMGIRSLWDLLLTTRNEFNQDRQDHRSQVESHLREIEAKFDQRISTTEGKVFRNFPLEEGIVKSLMAKSFADYPVRDLGLEPPIETILEAGGMGTVGSLLRRPIFQWIPRESLPAQSVTGRREAMTDSVIRSLFALLHGAPPRRYRASSPDTHSLDTPLKIDPNPPPPPVLEGVSEGELVRRLVFLHGNIGRVSESFGRTPLEVAEFIQRHDAHSELNIFQAYGKGTMLFYTPALRHAVGLWGQSVHHPESLSRLELSPRQRTQLQVLGVDSIRDLFLLTGYDMERTLGAVESERLGKVLHSQLNARLNDVEPYRPHRIFRPGALKEAMTQVYAAEPIQSLDLPPATLALLRAQGIGTIGELMSRPIPAWIDRQSLPEGSPSDLKAGHLDSIIRANYALLMKKFRFPHADGWE